MYPSLGEYDAPSVCPGAIAGFIASTSSGSTQRTSSPTACCIAIRSCAAATSGSEKHGTK